MRRLAAIAAVACAGGGGAAGEAGVRLAVERDPAIDVDQVGVRVLDGGREVLAARAPAVPRPFAARETLDLVVEGAPDGAAVRIAVVGLWEARVVAGAGADAVLRAGEYVDVPVRLVPGSDAGDGGVAPGGDGGGGGDCRTGETRPCGSDVGICREGTRTCLGGAWGVCAGEVPPGVEACNFSDDDCDGDADEGCACTAGARSVQAAAVTGNVGRRPSIAVSADGAVHVTHMDPGTGALWYTRLPAGGMWQSEPLANGAGPTQDRASAIAAALDGTLHVVYPTWPGPALDYARRPPGEDWQVERADGSGAVGLSCAIALAPDGTVWASYYDDGGDDLKVARRAAGAWQAETVDAAGDVGRPTAIAVDPAGTVHVGYGDASNQRLKYAALASGEDEWTLEVVEAAVDVPGHADLAVDASGTPHAAYFDDDNDALRYARRAGPDDWETEIVEAGQVGLEPSIAVTPAGGVHVSFRSIADPDLWYAHRAAADAAWWTARIDETGVVGLESSIALDPRGAAWIAYRDQTALDLKVATVCPVR